ALGAVGLVGADVTADAAGEARRIAVMIALRLLARLAPLFLALPRLDGVGQPDEALDDRHAIEASTRSARGPLPVARELHADALHLTRGQDDRAPGGA